MRIHETATELIRTRPRAVRAANPRQMRAEVSRFAQLLFRAPVVQPLVLELTRRERPWVHRFCEQQLEMFLDVARALGDLLQVHPHRNVQGRYVCRDPACETSIRELDDLLVEPEAADLPLAPSGIPVHRTPVGRAIDCLQICAKAHFARDAARNEVRLEERISELRTRHAQACQERNECLRVSPAWSLEVLSRWVESTKAAGDGGAATILEREAHEHVVRVGTELLSIASATVKAHGAVEQFRRMCEGELRAAVLACALRQLPDGMDSELTLWAQRSLDSHGVAGWSFAEHFGPALEPVTAMGRVVVQAVSYRTSPRTKIAEALRRFAACLEAAPWVLCGEAYLLVFRLGGPECLLPHRLDFDRLAISIVFINVAEKSPESAITVEAEELMTSVAGIGGCADAGARE